MNAVDRHERIARADLLLWIAELLGPPEKRRHASCPPGQADLQELASRSGFYLRPGAAALLLRVGDLLESTDPVERRNEHARLFDGAVACPLNETAWIRRDKGAILADIAGFYNAFGFAIASDAGEKQDHVVAELQFTGLLLVMLSEAEHREHAEAVEVTRHALAAFAEDHLDAWLDGFCGRLEQTARLPLYTELAALLRAAWEHTVVRDGLPRAAEPADTDPLADTGTPYECGMCPAADQSEADGPDRP